MRRSAGKSWPSPVVGLVPRNLPRLTDHDVNPSAREMTAVEPLRSYVAQPGRLSRFNAYLSTSSTPSVANSASSGVTEPPANSASTR